MITIEDIKNAEKHIIETRKPLDTYVQVKKESGEIEKIPVKIIINPKAKIKYIKYAVPITIKEIWKTVKDCETFEEQQEKIALRILKGREFYKSVVRAKETFNGKIIDIR